jgi:hypothetical protein
MRTCRLGTDGNSTFTQAGQNCHRRPGGRPPLGKARGLGKKVLRENDRTQERESPGLTGEGGEWLGLARQLDLAVNFLPTSSRTTGQVQKLGYDIEDDKSEPFHP